MPTNTDEMIKDILLNIKTHEVRTTKQIEEDTLMIVNEIFDDFICYPRNLPNKEEALKELEGWEFIHPENLRTGMIVKFFNMRYFYDLKLNKGRYVSSKDDTIKVHVDGSYKIVKNKHFFKEITEKDRVKISLIEAIYEKNKN